MNPTSIPRRQNADKHREIMEAGRRVIFREGIWNTTTRKIADEAGISLATIHYYFANKDELLVAIYEEMISSIRGYAAQDFATPGTLVERIAGVIEVSWNFSEKNMDAQLMQAELTLYALRNGMQPLAKRQGMEFLEIYLKVLGSSSDAAGRNDLDIRGLAQLILAGIDGLLVAHMVDPDVARSASACRQLAQVACHFPLTTDSPPLTPLLLSTPAQITGARRQTNQIAVSLGSGAPGQTPWPAPVTRRPACRTGSRRGSAPSFR